MISKRLAIGYVMQADSVDMARVSGPQLHVKAVVEGLKKRGHGVRTIAIQNGRTVWSDDLVTWWPAVFGFSESRWFRILESLVRGAQSRLRLPFLRLFDSYRFSDACVSTLTGCDILYERFGFLSYGGLLAAKRLGIPIVYEMNGDLVDEFAQEGIRLSWAQWKVIDMITRRMFVRADGVVAVSETLKQSIGTRWCSNPSKVMVVANGANVDLFARPETTDRVRAQYLPNGEPSIAFVSGFQPWHGIDLLLGAFDQVAGLNADVRLVLVGDGPVRRDLESKTSGLNLVDRVVFTGTLSHEDVAGLLGISDIAVVNPRSSPVTKSQSPLKLFEYMAAGKAIVAPAIPEMEPYLTNGVNALLVPPDDQEALARALLELLENVQLRAALGQAAREQAIERHSWDHTIVEVERTLYGLLST